VPSTLNGTIRRSVMTKKELRPEQANELYSSSVDHLSLLLLVAGMGVQGRWSVQLRMVVE
jgi:hypothetical protein